jgi:hypothetical protein
MEAEEAIALFVAGAVLGGIAVHVYLTRFRSAPQHTAQHQPVMVNKETWEWRDWRGRPRSITVHREVRQLE